MSGVDAELYLRCFAERSLLDGPENRPWDTPLAERARALAAVDAIDAERAQRIVDDYARAAALRGRGGHRPHPGRRARPTPPAAPPPRRIAFTDRVLDRPWGRLRIHHVVLDDDAARITATVTELQPSVPPGPLPQVGPRRARRHHGPFGPPSLTISDDRGTSGSLDSGSGGGSGDEWHCRLHSDRPLAADTAWLEIDGERFELVDSLAGIEVSVRSLAGQDPVERYLRHCLERMGEHHGHGGNAVGEAVEALVGAGVVAPDAPVVEQTLAAAGVADGSGQRVGGGNPTAVGRTPEPWRSLATRLASTDGPTGRLRLGAVTPVFDGIRATVCGLAADESGFRIDIGMVGPLPPAGPFEVDPVRSPVTFAATDDRGNFYLGALGDWSGSDREVDGTVEFWPGLDPRADALTITITADRAQAVIRTPLRWEPES